MKYRLAIKPSASRELERLEDQWLCRVDEAIRKLADNPRPHGAKKLSGVPLYRIRVGTITIGTNELIGTDPTKLPPAQARLMAGQWKKGAIPPLWDGKAAERIVEHLERLLLHS